MPIHPAAALAGRAGPVAVTGLPEPPADAELVARVAVGDQGAFAALYDRHVDVVYGSVVRFLGDRQLAEEVVQDAFVTVWRQPHQFAPEVGSFVAWVLRIARNKAIDRSRAMARRPRLLAISPGGDAQEAERLEALLAAGEPVASGHAAGAVDEAALRAWIQAVVRTALTTMPAPERQALELAYDDGLSQAEIAVRLGWPLGTVKSRTRRGLATLRQLLEAVPELVETSPPREGGPSAAR